jgi:hypothetical protein
MASIRREIEIDREPEEVWAALRQWDALHQLASGFVTGCERQGNARIVTFASGAVLREEILGCDEQERRLAWTITDGPYTHHNGAAQVLATEHGSARVVWTSDLLPEALAEPTAGAMDKGLEAIKATLEQAAR